MSEYANPYAPQPAPMAPPGPSRTSGMAIWSFVLGLAGAFCCAGLTAIIGVPLGIAALSAIGRSGGMLTGRGLAITGIIIGILSIIVYACAAIFLVPGFVEGIQATTNHGEAFMRHLSNDEFAEAHAMLEDETRGQISAAQLRGTYEAASAELGKLTGWQVVGSDGDGDPKDDNRARIRITYNLTWERGTSVAEVEIIAEAKGFLSGDANPRIRSFKLR